MAEELRSFPFCGGSDVHMMRDTGDERDHVVWCRSCGAHGGVGYNPWLAREKWNRRSERTCRVVRGGEMSPTGVQRERRCSECGKILTRFGSYCPNCGARVVGE